MPLIDADHPMKPVEVALADSNPLMLAALSEFFERDPRFSLVVTTNSAESFLDAVQRVPVGVGIVDWVLPKLGGERLLLALRERGGGPRIVVYGSSDTQDAIRRVMAAGAAGFCSRDKSPEELLAIVEGVARGQMMFPFVDLRELNRDPVQSLTARERMLLGSLARGLTNKALASEHGIAVNTVKFHLRNLFDKLAVDNRAQAIAFYYSSGLNTRDERI
ncbi:MAG: LuxR C-terminal-related transcriptional regulator [Parvibaculaceae bacterium]